MAPTSKYLISVPELAQRLHSESMVVFDCRFDLRNPMSGRQQYEDGHIPHSRYVSLDDDLADPPGKRGRHPLPSQESLAEKLGDWGASNDSQIVVYDDSDSIFACRFWWMVRWLGHDNVAVLNGGLRAWAGEKQPLTKKIPDCEPRVFKINPSLTKTVDANDVLDYPGTVLDARNLDRFHGKNESMDHTAGHIPNAVCSPFSKNLDENGQFLQDMKHFADINRDSTVISYCGSGVTATHNILALLIAGHNEPALYPGSWSEWIEDPSRPIAT